MQANNIILQRYHSERLNMRPSPLTPNQVYTSDEGKPPTMIYSWRGQGRGRLPRIHSDLTGLPLIRSSLSEERLNKIRRQIEAKSPPVSPTPITSPTDTNTSQSWAISPLNTSPVRKQLSAFSKSSSFSTSTPSLYRPPADGSPSSREQKLPLIPLPKTFLTRQTSSVSSLSSTSQEAKQQLSFPSPRSPPPTTSLVSSPRPASFLSSPVNTSINSPHKLISDQSPEQLLTLLTPPAPPRPPSVGEFITIKPTLTSSSSHDAQPTQEDIDTAAVLRSLEEFDQSIQQASMRWEPAELSQSAPETTSIFETKELLSESDTYIPTPAVGEEEVSRGTAELPNCVTTHEKKVKTNKTIEKDVVAFSEPSSNATTESFSLEEDTHAPEVIVESSSSFKAEDRPRSILTGRPVSISKFRNNAQTVRQQIKPGFVNELTNLFSSWKLDSPLSASFPPENFDYNFQETMQKLTSPDGKEETSSSSNSQIKENTTLHQVEESRDVNSKQDDEKDLPTPILPQYKNQNSYRQAEEDSITNIQNIPDPRHTPGIDYLAASREIFKHFINVRTRDRQLSTTKTPPGSLGVDSLQSSEIPPDSQSPALMFKNIVSEGGDPSHTDEVIPLTNLKDGDSADYKPFVGHKKETSLTQNTHRSDEDTRAEIDDTLRESHEQLPRNPPRESTDYETANTDQDTVFSETNQAEPATITGASQHTDETADIIDHVTPRLTWGERELNLERPGSTRPTSSEEPPIIGSQSLGNSVCTPATSNSNIVDHSSEVQEWKSGSAESSTDITHLQNLKLVVPTDSESLLESTARPYVDTEPHHDVMMSDEHVRSRTTRELETVNSSARLGERSPDVSRDLSLHSSHSTTRDSNDSPLVGVTVALEQEQEVTAGHTSELHDVIGLKQTLDLSQLVVAQSDRPVPETDEEFLRVENGIPQQVTSTSIHGLVSVQTTDDYLGEVGRGDIIAGFGNNGSTISEYARITTSSTETRSLDFSIPPAKMLKQNSDTGEDEERLRVSAESPILKSRSDHFSSILENINIQTDITSGFLKSSRRAGRSLLNSRDESDERNSLGRATPPAPVLDKENSSEYREHLSIKAKEVVRENMSCNEPSHFLTQVAAQEMEDPRDRFWTNSKTVTNSNGQPQMSVYLHDYQNEQKELNDILSTHFNSISFETSEGKDYDTGSENNSGDNKRQLTPKTETLMDSRAVGVLQIPSESYLIGVADTQHSSVGESPKEEDRLSSGVPFTLSPFQVSENVQETIEWPSRKLIVSATSSRSINGTEQEEKHHRELSATREKLQTETHTSSWSHIVDYEDSARPQLTEQPLEIVQQTSFDEKTQFGQSEDIMAETTLRAVLDKQTPPGRDSELQQPHYSVANASASFSALMTSFPSPNVTHDQEDQMKSSEQEGHLFSRDKFAALRNVFERTEPRDQWEPSPPHPRTNRHDSLPVGTPGTNRHDSLPVGTPGTESASLDTGVSSTNKNSGGAAPTQVSWEGGRLHSGLRRPVKGEEGEEEKEEEDELRWRDVASRRNVERVRAGANTITETEANVAAAVAEEDSWPGVQELRSRSKDESNHVDSRDPGDGGEVSQQKESWAYDEQTVRPTLGSVVHSYSLPRDLTLSGSSLQEVGTWEVTSAPNDNILEQRISSPVVSSGNGETVSDFAEKTSANLDVKPTEVSFISATFREDNFIPSKEFGKDLPEAKESHDKNQGNQVDELKGKHHDSLFYRDSASTDLDSETSSAESDIQSELIETFLRSSFKRVLESEQNQPDLKRRDSHRVSPESPSAFEKSNSLNKDRAVEEQHGFMRDITKDLSVETSPDQRTNLNQDEDDMTAIVGELSSFSIHKKITTHEESQPARVERLTSPVGSLDSPQPDQNADIYLIQDKQGDYYALQEVPDTDSGGSHRGAQQNVNLHILESTKTNSESRFTNGHPSRETNAGHDFLPGEVLRTDIYVDSAAVQDDKAEELIAAFLTSQEDRRGVTDADISHPVVATSNRGSVIVQQGVHPGVTGDTVTRVEERSHTSSYSSSLKRQSDGNQTHTYRSNHSELGDSTQLVRGTQLDNSISTGQSSYTSPCSLIPTSSDVYHNQQRSLAVNPFHSAPITITTTTQAVVGEQVGMHISYPLNGAPDAQSSSSDEEDNRKRYVVRNVQPDSTLRHSGSFSDSSSELAYPVGSTEATLIRGGQDLHHSRAARYPGGDMTSPGPPSGGPIYKVYQSQALHPSGAASRHELRNNHNEAEEHAYRLHSLSSSAPDGLHISDHSRGRTRNDTKTAFQNARKQHRSPERFFKNPTLSLRKDDARDEPRPEKDGETQYRTVTKVFLDENRSPSPEAAFKVSRLQLQNSYNEHGHQVDENDNKIYSIKTVQSSEFPADDYQGHSDDTDSGYQEQQKKYKIVGSADTSDAYKHKAASRSLPQFQEVHSSALTEATITRTESVQPSRLQNVPPAGRTHKTVIQLDVEGSKIKERRSSEDLGSVYQVKRVKSVDDVHRDPKLSLTALNRSQDDRKMRKTSTSRSSDGHRYHSSIDDDDSDYERNRSRDSTGAPLFKTLRQTDGKKTYVINSPISGVDSDPVHAPGWYKSTIDINQDAPIHEDPAPFTSRLHEDVTSSRHSVTERSVLYNTSSSQQTSSRNYQRQHSSDVVHPDSGQGTEVTNSDGEPEMRQKLYERVERNYELRREPRLPEHLKAQSMEDLHNDLRVLRGNILIKNRLNDTDHGGDDFDENVNLFDNSFHLGKDNPLYSSDQDILASLRKEEDQDLARHVQQDITFETVDRIAHQFQGERQVQVRQPERKKQNLSALLLSKLANVDSKDIRQTIDVEHHNEEIYGDIDFVHADGERKDSQNTRNFDSVNEKVELTLTQGKAHVIIKVIAERIVPTDFEFNVWRKSQAIVTRQIEIDLLANEQRRRLYQHVMERAETAGYLEDGRRYQYNDSESLSPQERQLSSMETLRLFSQILDVTDGQGDKDLTETRTRQEMGQLPPSAMDLLY